MIYKNMIFPKVIHEIATYGLQQQSMFANVYASYGFNSRQALKWMLLNDIDSSYYFDDFYQIYSKNKEARYSFVYPPNSIKYHPNQMRLFVDKELTQFYLWCNCGCRINNGPDYYKSCILFIKPKLLTALYRLCINEPNTYVDIEWT